MRRRSDNISRDRDVLKDHDGKPFGSRPDDQLGIGVGRTHYNGRAASALALATPGSEKPDSEYEAELYYDFHAIRGVVPRPNVQYIVDPGGYSRGVTDVVVIGGRFDVNFQAQDRALGDRFGCVDRNAS